uniref:RNase H type-1 domain-containing protein n=1 Tax=Cannabis sativa TaxID=3483 RepID=A0A803NGV7_CANSA
MNRGIMQELGLNMATTNINYLGLSLFRSKHKDADFNFILENLISKLHDWKLKSLSKAGRATLIRSIGLAMPVYTMQTTKLSKNIDSKIDDPLIVEVEASRFALELLALKQHLFVLIESDSEKVINALKGSYSC